MKSSAVILLVEPENPDNIGAVARAMKNMDLKDLRLIHPPQNWKKLGEKMSMSAFDVLENARVFESVPEAVFDTAFVIGATRRKRRYTSNFISFEKCIKKFKSTRSKKPFALMFGKESKGLSNADLSFCDWITSIPANPVYPSINLAQAVMIFAFTLFRLEHDSLIIPQMGMGGDWVQKKEEYEVLDSLKSALEVLEYSESRGNMLSRIVTTFHGLIKRNGLLKREAQMLKGISRRICEKADVSVLKEEV